MAFEEEHLRNARSHIITKRHDIQLNDGENKWGKCTSVDFFKNPAIP